MPRTYEPRPAILDQFCRRLSSKFVRIRLVLFNFLSPSWRFSHREIHFSVATTGEVGQIIVFPIANLASRVPPKPICFASFRVNLFFHRQSGDVSPLIYALYQDDSSVTEVMFIGWDQIVWRLSQLGIGLLMHRWNERVMVWLDLPSGLHLSSQKKASQAL